MALQVWLPLNGNLDNQGLNGAIVTNHGAIVNSNGKIGQCYQNTASNYCTIPVTINSALPFSMCFWYRIDTWVGWGTALTLNDANGNYIGICPHSNGTSVGTNWYEGSTSISDRYHSLVFTTGVWYHFAIVSDGNSIKTFINGIQSNVTTAYSNSPTKTFTQLTLFRRGTTTTYGRNSLNDVRVYDHALSDKEAREISKGLVLHYKLDNNGFGGENLLLRTNQGTTCWGYNIGNKYKQPTKTTVEWLGVQAMQAVTNGLNDSYTSTWCLIDYNDSNIYKVLRPSTQYTISFDSTNRHTSLNIRQGNGLNPMLTAECNLSSIERKDENGETYYHLYGTFTTVANFEGSGQYVYISSSMGYMNTAGNTVKYANIKIEEGTRDTSWCPNRSDTMGVALGMNDEIEYDCSGYGHDGVYVLTAESDTSSPRYDACTHFVDDAPSANSNTGGFIRGPIHMSGHKEITFAWWGKHTPGYGGGWQGLLSTSTNSSYPSDYTTSTLNQYDNRFRFTNGTSGTDYHLDVASIVVSGEWHHYALTYDGAIAKGYRDGVLVTSLAFSYTQLGAFEYIYINRSHAGGVYRTNDGRWSDFRIYATALSQSDIEELYNVGQSIDNHGNLYAYSYKEE